MDLSVIIVNWNTQKLLENCLRSIFKFTRGVTFEVIVVDNGSTDNSPGQVKKKFPQVKLLSNKDNLGFSRANNQGIQVAKGEYIMLLNSDTYLIENSLRKMVEEADKFPSLGALGPTLLNRDRTIQQSVGFFPNLAKIFWWMSFIDDLPGGTFLKPYHVDHDVFYKRERQVDWVTAAAILVPKSTITRVGLLDEKIFMYGEEVEWCYRIKKSGDKVYFSPVTKIIHIGRGSSQKTSTNAIVGEFKGIQYFYLKHKNKTSLQIARLLLKIGALARIIIFGALSRKELVKSYVAAFKVA